MLWRLVNYYEEGFLHKELLINRGVISAQSRVIRIITLLIILLAQSLERLSNRAPGKPREEGTFSCLLQNCFLVHCVLVKEVSLSYHNRESLRVLSGFM